MDTEQSDRLWLLFNEALHTGDVEEIEGLINYCQTAGLDVTAEAMKAELAKANLAAPPNEL